MITKFANSITVVSNSYFSVSATASASNTKSATKANSATIIASTQSQKEAVSKMNKLLKKHKLENTPSTAVTTYKLTGSPSATWSGISISGTNSIACVTDYANAANNLIYYSGDGGKNWSQTNASSNNQWSSVSISGSTALASNFLSANAKGIYYSSDSGKTWVPTGNTESVLNVTIDDSNAIKINVQNGYLTTIYYANAVSTSTNINWVLSTTSFTSYVSVVSNSGSNAVLCEQSGHIYYSNDSGKTWTKSLISPFKNWLSVSISGSNAVACDETSQHTYYSSDSGVNWFQSTFQSTATPSSFTCVSISGTHAVAGGNGGKIYYSDDSGVTWNTSNSDPNRWWRISIDGPNAVACVYGGNIYYSTDYGASWNLS